MLFLIHSQLDNCVKARLGFRAIRLCRLNWTCVSLFGSIMCRVEPVIMNPCIHFSGCAGVMDCHSVSGPQLSSTSTGLFVEQDVLQWGRSQRRQLPGSVCVFWCVHKEHCHSALETCDGQTRSVCVRVCV